MTTKKHIPSGKQSCEYVELDGRTDAVVRDQGRRKNAYEDVKVG